MAPSPSLSPSKEPDPERAAAIWAHRAPPAAGCSDDRLDIRAAFLVCPSLIMLWEAREATDDVDGLRTDERRSPLASVPLASCVVALAETAEPEPELARELPRGLFCRVIDIGEERPSSSASALHPSLALSPP